MSDVVERLRGWVYTHALYVTASEAADEIERLRRELEGCKGRLRLAQAVEEQLVAEADEWRKTADGVRKELYALTIKGRSAPAGQPSTQPQQARAPRGCASCGRT